MPLALTLEDLHIRHPGLTRAIAESFCEAARVCLDRHHAPAVSIEIRLDRKSNNANAMWTPTDEQTRHAWANEIDATEAGACGLALAAIEAAGQMVAMRRAETRTGADYYIIPIGSASDDLEGAYRLEVSGMNVGNTTQLEARLRQKIDQALAGNSNLPAFAAVVGFALKAILIESAVKP